MPGGKAHKCQPKVSTGLLQSGNTKLRDALLSDVLCIKTRIRHFTKKFFGDFDLEHSFRTAVYAMSIEHESGRIAAHAQFDVAPNISALPRADWLNWIRKQYGLMQITYGNTLFLKFFNTDDPYNPKLLHDVLQEIFLRERKIKYICTVKPPIDSIYDEILGAHFKQIFSLDQSINCLSQSIFICERYSIIPKMRLRRALAEDNDDLVEIIDESLRVVREELGDFYIAEQVLKNDPSDNIIVAEISDHTVGMIWINTNIHRRALADNFEISAYGNFIKPQNDPKQTDTRVVTDLVRRESEEFFHCPTSRATSISKEMKVAEENRLSMNNLYTYMSVASLGFSQDNASKNLFDLWRLINRNYKTTRNYTTEIRRAIYMPSTTEATNVFAIQLFGLTSSVDKRRIFDLVAAAFSSHPDKDYCLISLSSAESSSDALSGPLLKYFSRVVPRPGCKISDCLYVTHKNSFLSEIEVECLTASDLDEVENMLCISAQHGLGLYHLAEVIQSMREFLENPWTSLDAMVMRSGGCPIGFAVLKQNCVMLDLRTNFDVYDTDSPFADWNIGELCYLHLHPAFVWEWVHVCRQIFRITGYSSMYYRLKREHNQPVLNSIILNMFPIFPRKRLKAMHLETYALYYLSINLCHLVRYQMESKIIIIGFNEVCKGFLRTLFFSPKAKNVQCLNITVITDCPGFIEAEHDTKSFDVKLQSSLFFQAKNKFDADYLRRLEFRTWVTFIGAKLKGINGEAKRVLLDNGTCLRYNRLYLMCSTRYSSPRTLNSVPTNYLEINGRLDKIIFYQKIRLLVAKNVEPDLPILVYGSMVMAHSCLKTLLDLEVKGSQICFIIPIRDEKMDFPEAFDDEYVSEVTTENELEAGIRIYENFKFIDWNLCPEDDAIESVIFESNYERIALTCIAFISFHGQAFAEHLRHTMEAHGLEIKNKKIVIDEKSKTNIQDVYACGRITQYRDQLFAKQVEQRFFCQEEVGNLLAMNFIHECRTGEQLNMLGAKFVKPLFRQVEIIGGLVFGGLRKPGPYVSRDVRQSLHNYGHDLVTKGSDGEYFRLGLDRKGFVTEITCLTRKYANVEIIYRLFGLHESIWGNLTQKCESGQIENLLDFFHENAFSLLIHDQFLILRQSIREKNLECLEEFFKDRSEINKRDIFDFLKERGMHESMQKEVIDFIIKHSNSLHPNYALPEDFRK